MPTFTFTSPEGKTYDVDGPEGATKEQAYGILQQRLGGEATTPPEPVSAPEVKPPQQSFGRQLGLTARAGLEGFVSPVTATADAIGSAANYFLPKTAQIPSSSEQFSKGLTEAGLPVPQTGIEQGVNLGANMLAGGAATPSGLVKGAQSVAAPAMRSGSEWLMNNALKPTPKEVLRGDAATAIDTMLSDGYSLSKSGVEKIRNNISVLNNQIKEKIASSSGTVKMNEVMKPVEEKLKFFEKQVNNESDMTAIRKSWNEFKNHSLIGGKSEIPVQLAQELKQGTNAQLAKKYGEMSSADIEAQKAIVRGLKEGVAKDSPEVAQFNKQESRLLRTLDIAERRVIMDANRNPMGIALLAHNPATWLTFMADKSAQFKALMARVLNASKEAVPEAFTRGAMGATSAAIQPPGMEQRAEGGPVVPGQIGNPQ